VERDFRARWQQTRLGRQIFAPSATIAIVFRHGESPIGEADPPDAIAATILSEYLTADRERRYS